MGVWDTIAGMFGAQTRAAGYDLNTRDLAGFLREYESERAVSQPISFAPSQIPSVKGIGSQPPDERLLQEVRGWQAIATRAIADRVAGLELQVGHMVQEGSRSTFDPQPKHPLQTLLDRPSPLHSRRNTLHLIANYVVTLGEAYLLKVGSDAGLTVELYVMLGGSVSPVLSAGVVSGYLVRDGSGTETPIAAEDVVRVWRPDPESLYTSVGFLGPQAIAADSSKFLSEHLRRHFERDATPRIILEPAKDAVAPGPKEERRFNLRWLARYNRRKGTLVGVPTRLPVGYTAKEFAAHGGTSELVPLLAHWRDQTLMAYGVPRSIVGDVVDANRAAAETNQLVFDRHTITPITDLIADALTHQLAQPEHGDAVVRFAEFVSEDSEHRLAEEQQDLSLKVRSIDQVREDRGLEPVTWGELPVGSPIDTPYTGEEPEPLELEPLEPNEPDEPPEDDDEDPEGDRSRAQTLAGWDGRARMEWQRTLDRERLFVPRFRAEMRRLFEQQARLTLNALRPSLELTRSRVHLSQQDFARASIQDMLAALRALFKSERFVELFRIRVEPIRREAMLRTGSDALDSAAALTGASLPGFQFTPQVQAELLRQASTFAEVVNATTFKELNLNLHRALADGAALGEPVDVLAKRIEGQIRGTYASRKRRAKVIARTELLQATQSAQVEGFRQSGVVERKRWNTSLDESVRDSHRINGQTRDLDEPFLLPADADGPAELAEAPGRGVGGERLSAHNTIGCRCFVTPEV